MVTWQRKQEQAGCHEPLPAQFIDGLEHRVEETVVVQSVDEQCEVEVATHTAQKRRGGRTAKTQAVDDRTGDAACGKIGLANRGDLGYINRTISCSEAVCECTSQPHPTSKFDHLAFKQM